MATSSELAFHFLKHSEHKHKRFTEEAIQALCFYSFPGNIRELKSVVEQSALLADDNVIHKSDLAPQVLGTVQKAMEEEAEYGIVPLDKAEEVYLQRICASFEGSPAELAQRLGVSTRTLYRKLQRYGLSLK